MDDDRTIYLHMPAAVANGCGLLSLDHYTRPCCRLRFQLVSSILYIINVLPSYLPSTIEKKLYKRNQDGTSGLDVLLLPHHVVLLLTFGGSTRFKQEEII